MGRMDWFDDRHHRQIAERDLIVASQLKREKVYGNFRVRGAPKPHKNSERYKKRPGTSPDHLDCIRKLPCCVCEKWPGGQCHHLKAGTGERGIGLRSTDRWSVPVCPHCHDAIERAGTRNETQWFRSRGIGSHELAQDLWAATGDIPKMTKIVIAHRNMK